MTKEELYAHPGWEECTFEGARRQVLRLGLKTTFREKLEWLEAMDDLSQRFGRSQGRNSMGAPETAAVNEVAVQKKPET